MNEIKKSEKINAIIYEIRGVQVMLDSDLARLYECKNGTKTINQAVKRHLYKFPERYMFQLTVEELKYFRGPNVGLQINKSRTLPYVFTEQGVAMLATMIKTPIAERISIQIIDAFVIMRKHMANNMLLNIEDRKMLIRHDHEIRLLYESLNKMSEKTNTNSLFYEGQIYDAYSLLIDILSKAKEEVIIIDNYAGKELLDALKGIKTKIILISGNIDKVLINKYEKQYHNVRFIRNQNFHDRFIIIDRNILYNCGASFKDLGKKCFAINKIENKDILNQLMDALFL